MGASMRAVQKEDVRPSVVAGFFYPGDPQQLQHELEELLDFAPSTNLSGDVVALVSPHAGYQYSGGVAATGFRQLQSQDVSVVAIISPSHHDTFPGVSVFNGRAFETPLGLVPIAGSLADALIDEDEVIESSWLGHRQEHALEVQLPFIQHVFPDSKILPVAVGRQSFECCRRLGRALARILAGERALIVATSDLSHFHSYAEAVQLDRRTGKLIEQFDERSLMRACKSGTCEACGIGPIIAAMVASKNLGADMAKTLLYRNSGDVSGDFSRVVGYLSAAFVRRN